MRKIRQRGISIIVTLLVLTIIMIIVFAVGAQGIWNLNYVNKDKYSKMATYAAEASLAVPLVGFKKGLTGWATCSNSFNSPNTYDAVERIGNYFEVTDNSAGTADTTASNGTVVKPGMVYFLGHGLACNKTIHKMVGVMVDAGTVAQFDYALASGGAISFNASVDLHGSLKCNSNFSINAQTEILKDNKGKGRVLVTGQIQNGSKWLKLDPTAAEHDCRARTGITGPSKVSDASPKVANDTTDDTNPFIVDGSTSPSATSGYETLPNPDVTDIMSASNLVTHSEENWSGDLNLDGKVHYFPNSSGTTGIQITGLSGKGTIVVGSYGKPGILSFSHPVDHEVNIVAVDGGTGPDWANSGTVGGCKVYFQNSTTIHGLIYSHGTITSNARFDVYGSVISYKGGSFVHNGAHSVFTLSPLAVQCPGFDAFFGGGGAGSGTVTVLSTQRF
ncbi:MAG: hypothetical protein AB2L14_19315 [Candidatus Xenobiia bacterium LiM19]